MTDQPEEHPGADAVRAWRVPPSPMRVEAEPMTDRDALLLAYGALLMLNENGRCEAILAAVSKTLGYSDDQ